MGGSRSPNATVEVFEPADPARTMPKSLVFATIAAVIVLIVIMSWLNRRSLSQSDEPNPSTPAAAQTQAAQQPAAPTAAPPASAQTAQGPVVIAASEPAWVQITDQGKTLFEGMMQAGQTFAVPPTATAPLLKAGKPEALQIKVGSAVAPPVGSAGKVASNVSLKPADLMRGTAQPSASPAAPAAPTQ